jgi:hypothetical protein
MKTATITVPIYETPTGTPTCCRDLAKGEACSFLRTQRMGTEMTCLFALQNGKPAEPLMEGQEGFLIPSPACPFNCLSNAKGEAQPPATKL